MPSTDPVKKKAARRRYYLQHQDHEKAATRRWVAAHPGYTAQWAADHPGARTLHVTRERAKRRLTDHGIV